MLIGWESVVTFILSGGLGGAITLLYAKRKAKAEAASSELDNAQKIINMQNDFIKDQNERHSIEKQEWLDKLGELQKRITELENKLSNHTELQEEVITLQKKVQHLECENTKLKKEIEKLKV